MSGRAARTDRVRTAVIMWGGWLIVTGAVLSFASGIIHTYYTVELAPAIAALVAIGAVVLWRRRGELAARVGLAAASLVTAWWSLSLLHRSAGWHPWVAVLAIVAGLIAAIAFLVPHGRLRFAGVAAVLAGLIAITGGSAAYALNTAATPQTGSIPSAGPTVSSAGIGGGRVGGGAGGPGRVPGGGTGGRPSGGLPGATGGRGFTPPTGGTGTTGRPTGAPTGGGGGGGATSVSSALATLLKQAGTTWSAATIGSQSAAPLELGSGTAVIAIGGFSGSDSAPTLAQFEKLVADGKVHYFIGGGQGGGGQGGGGQGGGGSSSITSWVQAHFSSTTVGGSTVYDLTKATSA